MITRIILLLALGFPFFSPADIAGSSPWQSIVTFPTSMTYEMGSIQPAYSGCGGVTPAPANAAYEQQVVELVNAQRWANGHLPPYKRVSALDSAARYHAVDMGEDDYFNHDSYDRVSGVLVKQCVWSARVISYYSGPLTLALSENIAEGPTDPAGVMETWMNSSGHRANILSADNWEIGVGYASDSGGTYGVYWAQDFGKKDGVYPLVINREAAIASSPSVSLYIYGAWEQVRLRNETGAWSPWLPFQNDLAWTLSPGTGTKMVTAEVRSGTAIVTSSDTISLWQAVYIPKVLR